MLSKSSGSMISTKFQCQICPSQYAQQSGLTRHIKQCHAQEYLRVVGARRQRRGHSNASRPIKYYFCPNRKCSRSRSQPHWPGFHRKDHMLQHSRNCRARAEEALGGSDSQEPPVVTPALEPESSSTRIDQQHARAENGELGSMTIASATGLGGDGVGAPRCCSGRRYDPGCETAVRGLPEGKGGDTE